MSDLRLVFAGCSVSGPWVAGHGDAVRGTVDLQAASEGATLEARLFTPVGDDTGLSVQPDRARCMALTSTGRAALEWNGVKGGRCRHQYAVLGAAGRDWAMFRSPPPAWLPAAQA